MSKTYHGSCVCKAIKFEVDIDLSKGTGKCNCTPCFKLRFWGAHVKPDAFRILGNEAELVSDYIMKNPELHHEFCKVCGTHAYHRGNLPGVMGEFVSVNVACLDDLPFEELEGVVVRYADGRNDAWWNEPKEKSIL